MSLRSWFKSWWPVVLGARGSVHEPKGRALAWVVGEASRGVLSEVQAAWRGDAAYLAQRTPGHWHPPTEAEAAEALYFATVTRAPDIVTWLLEQGANPNRPIPHGWNQTPFMWAIQQHDPRVLAVYWAQAHRLDATYRTESGQSYTDFAATQLEGPSRPRATAVHAQVQAWQAAHDGARLLAEALAEPEEEAQAASSRSSAKPSGRPRL